MKGVENGTNSTYIETCTTSTQLLCFSYASTRGKYSNIHIKAKCLHALHLFKPIATEKQKETLATKNESDSAAREASHETVQHCMAELLNMECEAKTREETKKDLLPVKTTAIAMGMGYKKKTALEEERGVQECKNSQTQWLETNIKIPLVEIWIVQKLQQLLGNQDYLSNFICNQVDI